ncbi:MAG: hypothetical protein HC869_17290 [Rhodospirillales bacterium]|nr:hypothetical protein [Rhodospirillales bacterium]
MPRWLRLSNCNAFVVFIFMGACGAMFAWMSYNLINLAMANIHFLSQYGALAIMEGGLMQLVEIILYGYLALAFYLGFKACEHELVDRWLK